MDRSRESDAVHEPIPVPDRSAPTIEPAGSTSDRADGDAEQGAFDRIRTYFHSPGREPFPPPSDIPSDTPASSEAGTSPRDAEDRLRAEDPLERATWAPAEVDAHGRPNELGKALLAHDRTLNHRPMPAAEFATLKGGPYGQVLGEQATEQRYTDSCAMAASSSALHRLGVPDGQRSLISLSLSEGGGYRGHLWKDGTYPARLESPPTGIEGTKASDATAVVNRALELGQHPMHAVLSSPGWWARGSLARYQDLVRPGQEEVLIEYPGRHMVHIDSVAPDLSSVTINESETGRKVLVDASTFDLVRRHDTTVPDILIRPSATLGA